MQIVTHAARSQCEPHDRVGDFIFVAGVFVLAGLVKGTIGLGLPTIAMGLLVLAMPPVEAAAVLILPSLVTNVWQMLAGPRLAQTLRRLWPMMVGICGGTFAGVGLMPRGPIAPVMRPWASELPLIAYAASGLAPGRAAAPRADRPLILPMSAPTGGVVGDYRPDHRAPPASRWSRRLLICRRSVSRGTSWCRRWASPSRSRLWRWRLHWPASTPLRPTSSCRRCWPSSFPWPACGLAKRCALRLRPQTFRLCFFVGLLALGAYLALRGLG